MKANTNQSLIKVNFTYSSGFSHHQWSKCVAGTVQTLSSLSPLQSTEDPSQQLCQLQNKPGIPL